MDDRSEGGNHAPPAGEPGGIDVSAFWTREGAWTLEERTYQFLHETIVSGALPPGAPLVGARLASRLGVSRITVAHALKRLASEGFVVGAPHRQAAVASLDESALDEVFRVRYALEREVMREAARRITPAAIAHLDRIDARIQAAVADGDAAEYRRLEREFHLLIYASAGLPLMASILTDLWNRLEPYRGRRYSGGALLAAALDDHRAIMAALRRHDEEDAARAMRIHVERGYQRFLRVLRGDLAAPEPGERLSLRPAGAGRWVSPAGSLRAFLDELPDARRPQGRVHGKPGVLALAVCAMLCGARSRYAITAWGHACHPAIRQAVGLRADQGPSGATVHRVFTALAPGELEAAVAAWLAHHGLAAPPHPGPDASESAEPVPAAGIVGGMAACFRDPEDGPCSWSRDARQWSNLPALLLGQRPAGAESMLAEIELYGAIGSRRADGD